MDETDELEYIFLKHIIDVKPIWKKRITKK
ncbi:hypothetical protein EV200_101347 [Pedobacter psychrotolerans]|uniref:Uncharacterized protein n=1 Tax=Pedobacter psychrotolerans TaxID=1843235 RepID=A0A4R2HLB7_9SPHI|nr:hypothetical protein EV200_101347 [Pedobacter psychrotolerans]